MKLPIENFLFPTFVRGTLLRLSRHTYVPRRTGWEALLYGINNENPGLLQWAPVEVGLNCTTGD